MKIELIEDMGQYNLLYDAVEEALRTQDVEVVRSKVYSSHFDADGRVFLQDVALNLCPRPRFFIAHGMSPAKPFGLNFDCEMVIVPSSRLFDIMKDGLKKPGRLAVGTGYPKIDLLLRRREEKAQIQAQVRAAHGFDDRPIVGYFPTYKHLGGMPHINRAQRLDDVERELSKAFNVIVLYHQLDKAHDEIEALEFKPSPDILRSDYMIACDAVVSDTSGIGIECAAIDLPVVLLDHPTESAFLAAPMIPGSPKLSYGPQVQIGDLVAAVESEIASPEQHRADRADWADLIFGPNDGAAGERIAREIIAAVEDYQEQHPAKGRSDRIELTDFLERGMQRFSFSKELNKTRRGGDIHVASDQPYKGTIFFGPYIKLPKGAYSLQVDIEGADGSAFDLRVTGNKANTRIQEMTFKRKLKAAVFFEIEEELLPSVEIVLRSTAEIPLDLSVRQLKLTYWDSRA